LSGAIGVKLFHKKWAIRKQGGYTQVVVLRKESCLMKYATCRIPRADTLYCRMDRWRARLQLITSGGACAEEANTPTGATIVDPKLQENFIFKRNLKLLAFGFWLLASGFWLLAFGFWLLAFGFWLLASGFWLLAHRLTPAQNIFLSRPGVLMDVARGSGGGFPRTDDLPVSSSIAWRSSSRTSSTRRMVVR